MELGGQDGYWVYVGVCEEEAFVISFPPTTHRGSKVYQANPQRLQKHNKLHTYLLFGNHAQCSGLN